MSETHDATTNIELSQPRVIALQGRKGVYTLTSRRVTLRTGRRSSPRS